MKKALLPLIVLFAACATPPTEIAEWARSPQALRQMFPDGAYLAQQGRGKTRGTAEIARYITSQVNTRSGYRMTATQTDGQGAGRRCI